MIQRKRTIKSAAWPLGLCTGFVVSGNLFAEGATGLNLQEIKIEETSYNVESSEYRAGYSSTADKTDTPFLQQSQAVETVTEQQLKDQAPRTLEDVIKFVPGAVVNNNFGGSQDAVMKRGFGNTDDGGVLRTRCAKTCRCMPITASRSHPTKSPLALAMRAVTSLKPGDSMRWA